MKKYWHQQQQGTRTCWSTPVSHVETHGQLSRVSTLYYKQCPTMYFGTRPWYIGSLCCVLEKKHLILAVPLYSHCDIPVTIQGGVEIFLLSPCGSNQREEPASCANNLECKLLCIKLSFWNLISHLWHQLATTIDSLQASSVGRAWDSCYIPLARFPFYSVQEIKVFQYTTEKQNPD